MIYLEIFRNAHMRIYSAIKVKKNKGGHFKCLGKRITSQAGAEDHVGKYDTEALSTAFVFDSE